MHIGLNLIFLVPGETGGMEVGARETIPALVAAAPPQTRFTAFVGRDAGSGPWGEIVDKIEVPVRASKRAEWVRGEQMLLPRLAQTAGVDLLHSLGSTAPAWGRFARVTTVHDLIYRILPEAHGRVRALGMRALVPLGVRRSDRIVAVSETTKRDLVSVLGVSPELVDVVYPGYGARSRVTALDEHELRQRLDLGDRQVLLSLSAKRRHKNLEPLLDALAELESRPILVMAGYPTDHELELRARAATLGIAHDVRWPGWLSDEEVEGLWAITVGFIFPSLYEGFGAPPLEAMARGVAVACSNTGATPEIAGDAALLFDPRDSRSVATALRQLLAGGAELERRKLAGIARAAEFTWERTASGLLATYEQALTGRRAAGGV
jgi:glycosyltransferase involved in cell wall biosynthesis